jgi:hypothetical protein
MNKNTIIILLIIACNHLYSNTYYVAPTGDNNNPGTKIKPLATIQKAHVFFLEPTS